MNELTYRQLVMLAMVESERHRSRIPTGWQLPDDGQVTLETLGFLDELYDLGRRRLIGFEREATLDSVSSFLGVNPEQLRASGVGSILVDAAHLNEIPVSDRTLRTWDAPPTD